ncbi:transporter substrate-binding domain-containing protein [Acetobacter nitrogenifigens]|uniref:Amino acid ABC transporter substrate-binding protein n=1 Tax=Acetobacter nitrogenifigens DSM 23921 = NBRC 105050 TaxID=1120919 RepID=A0A511XBS8_9PROT|nr:transporter substrate-binding domain-containing protein [Acetobacter nitrogenifigens]GEN60414.1 amino acid ABC transporter substrate-binding protein [Acetobacter nitrogenifigens DSM 23921 = NBRC 105050]
MNRRSILRLGLLAAPAMVASHGAKAGDSPLMVGVHAGGPPFCFRKRGSYTGFDIDVWSEIASGIGRNWKTQQMEFDVLIPALQTRSLDVVVSQLFVKPARQKVIDFSESYYKSGLIAVTRVDNTTIHTASDLTGKTIGAETGTIGTAYIRENIKNATIAEMPSITEALLALEAGRTDAVVYDTPVLMYYAHTGGKGKVRVIKPDLEGRDVCVGFPKGSPLVAQANTQLAFMKKNGRLAALNEKWFGHTEE